MKLKPKRRRSSSRNTVLQDITEALQLVEGDRAATTGPAGPSASCRPTSTPTSKTPSPSHPRVASRG